MRFVIRVDNISAVSKQLRSFAESMIDKQLPITYAVVPATVDSDANRFFLDLMRDHPRLVAVVPYGWSAQNHGSIRGSYEFGESRSRAEQWEDVRRVIERMDRLFMHRWSRVFVAPWNGFDKTTELVLKQNMFKAISGKYDPYVKRELPDVGCSVVLKEPKLAREIVADVKFILGARKMCVVALSEAAIGGVYIDEVRKAIGMLVTQGAHGVLIQELAGISDFKIG